MNGRSEKLTWLGKGATAVADQGLFAAAGFLLNVLLARWLPADQYGAYALAFSIFIFLSGIHNALLLEPMAVFGPASYRNSLPEYLGKLLRLHFTLTVLLAVLLGLGITVFDYWPQSVTPASALWGVGVGIPWILFFWLWRRAAYLDLRPGWAVRGVAAYSLVVLALAFALHRQGWLSPFTAFVLQAVAALVGSGILMIWIRPKLSSLRISVPMRDILKQHWEYGRWVVVASIVYWLSTGAYYVIVGALLRIEDVAALRALQNFVLPVSQFITAMSLLLLPWASARFADQGSAAFRRSIGKISLLFIAAGVAFLIGILLFGKLLMEVFYGGRYTQFAYLLPLLALPALLIAAAQGPAIAVRAMQAPSEVFLGYAAAASLTLLAGVALTRYWGLVGAALGMAISSLAFLIVITYRYYNRLKKSLLSESAVERESSPKRIRVAWLSPSLARGYYHQPVFRELTKLFPNTVIFTALWPGFLPGYEGTFEIRRLSGFKLVTQKRGPTDSRTLFVWAPLSVLWELLKFRPVVVFTSAFTIWTLYALAFKALARSRVIVLWDGNSPLTMRLNAPLRLAIRRTMARFIDAIASNTREGVDYLRDVLAIPDFKLLHHPYEVPETTVLCSGDNEGAMLRPFRRPVFLFVGRLIEGKGCRYLLQAARLLVESGLSSFSVAFVGEGPATEELRQLISALELENHVTLVGGVRYENLGGYFRACDVFVLPTLEDVWGMVVLEAMAFGKAVLCSKYAGSKELVEHGTSGFVFDPFHPADLAECMARFIRQPDLIGELGARSKEIIGSYTPEHAANGLAGLVLKVAGSESAS